MSDKKYISNINKLTKKEKLVYFEVKLYLKLYSFYVNYMKKMGRKPRLDMYVKYSKDLLKSVGFTIEEIDFDTMNAIEYACELMYNAIKEVPKKHVDISDLNEICENIISFSRTFLDSIFNIIELIEHDNAHPYYSPATWDSPEESSTYTGSIPHEEFIDEFEYLEDYFDLEAVFYMGYKLIKGEEYNSNSWDLSSDDIYNEEDYEYEKARNSDPNCYLWD